MGALEKQRKRAAFWLLIYSTFAILAAYVMASAWGAGNETMSLAAGAAHGSAFKEAVIKGVAYSSGPTGLISFGLILWGLRLPAAASGRPGPFDPSDPIR